MVGHGYDRLDSYGWKWYTNGPMEDIQGYKKKYEIEFGKGNVKIKAEALDENGKDRPNMNSVWIEGMTFYVVRWKQGQMTKEMAESHIDAIFPKKKTKKGVKKPVIAKVVSGYNVSWNLNFLSGPKLTIMCGKCAYTFQERMPLMDYPTVICPNCKTVNGIPFVYEYG